MTASVVIRTLMKNPARFCALATGRGHQHAETGESHARDFRRQPGTLRARQPAFGDIGEQGIAAMHEDHQYAIGGDQFEKLGGEVC